MKRRNSLYFKLNKARKIMERPLSADLLSLLQAAKELSRSNIVRKHIEESLFELGYTLKPRNQYKMTA